MEAQQLDRATKATVKLLWFTGDEACGEYMLSQVGDGRRIGLNSAHFAEFRFTIRQMRDFMRERKCLRSQQNAEQQQSYRVPD